MESHHTGVGEDSGHEQESDETPSRATPLLHVLSNIEDGSEKSRGY